MCIPCIHTLLPKFTYIVITILCAYRCHTRPSLIHSRHPSIYTLHIIIFIRNCYYYYYYQYYYYCYTILYYCVHIPTRIPGARRQSGYLYSRPLKPLYYNIISNRYISCVQIDLADGHGKSSAVTVPMSSALPICPRIIFSSIWYSAAVGEKTIHNMNPK